MCFTAGNVDENKDREKMSGFFDVKTELPRATVGGIDHRRIAFNDFFRTRQVTANELCGVRKDHIFNVSIALYYFLYYYLVALNNSRGGLLGDLLLHHCALRVLNDCARGNYDSLYEMLFG